VKGRIQARKAEEYKTAQREDKRRGGIRASRILSRDGKVSEPKQTALILTEGEELVGDRTEGEKIERYPLIKVKEGEEF